MKISILTPDISHNCFGRAWLLAELLKHRYAVEVVGPAFGKGIWMPLKDMCDFEIKVVKGYEKGRFEFKRMLRSISGDILYASKPLIPSFGVGLVKKALTGKLLLLDIDDWELGFGKTFFDSLVWYKKIDDLRRSIADLNGYSYKLMMDKLIDLADGITVSGKGLHSMYGGMIIWHGRKLNPTSISDGEKKELKRTNLHLYDEKRLLLGFIGTPRPHKGLVPLITALADPEIKDMSLLIVGMDNSEYCRYLERMAENLRLGTKIIFLPEQPFSLLPMFLSIVDVVVIPQLKSPASAGQIPAKLFDAMAMGKPLAVSENIIFFDHFPEGIWSLPMDNKKRIVNVLKEIQMEKDVLSIRSAKVRRLYDTNFHWDLLRKKMNLFMDLQMAKTVLS